MNLQKRSTFSFDPTTVKRLDQLADQKGVSNTEVLRRAIALYDYLESQRVMNGEVTFVDKSGKQVHIVLP